MKTNEWHQLASTTVVQQLGSDVSSGLSSTEAAQRLVEYGTNELSSADRISPWMIFLGQFRNVLIAILLVAILLSIFLGHGAEAIAIALIVFFAVLLGFAQEYRSERALEALRQMTAPTATALRDGQEVVLPARDIVPGDVILLRSGDKVSADARLVEAVNLQIEEAALTGESLPVEKQTETMSGGEWPVAERKNMAYAGTAVTYGRGQGVVVATGMATEFGKTAAMLETVASTKTPLQDNLDKVGNALAQASLFIVAVIVGVGLYRGQPFVEMIIFGIALAVAAVPEALPAVVTISLALGVQRMAKRNALVRRLPAVETLGSTSVICSDKTGTLTKDEMTARQVYVAQKLFEVSGAGFEPRGEFMRAGLVVEPCAPLKSLLRAAVLTSDARLVQRDGRWEVKGDPTEGALIVLAAKAGLQKMDLEKECPRVHEIPFSSEAKRMTTIHHSVSGLIAYAKGAPEIILEACTFQLTEIGEEILDQAHRETIQKVAREMARGALRVLAVAYKTNSTPENCEKDMVFLGLVGMSDPPRPEARVAIQRCRQAGIKPVMITGDHPVTAEAVAGELGLLRNGRVITGTGLESMSEPEFERAIEDISVYARVSPAHKLRVVSTLQKKDYVVAMTGDGINDAPALKKADIGIAMGITGTEVSREAAAMTLTDDNFVSIVAAVEEGRVIFNNIKKYLMYLLSSNIGEIGLMLGAALLGLPLPLTAVQILYVNLATDGLPALALAVDPPEEDIMRRPPRNRRTGILTRPVVILMLVGGLWSMTVNLLLFHWLLATGHALNEAMAMIFVLLVTIQFFKAYNFRSDHMSAFQRPFANRWLNISILGELVLLGLIVHVPLLQTFFGTFSMNTEEWFLIVLSAATIIPVLEISKWLARRGWFGKLN